MYELVVHCFIFSVILAIRFTCIYYTYIYVLYRSPSLIRTKFDFGA